MGSADWSAEAQEAIWEASQQYGLRLTVSEQVSVTRALVRLSPASVTTNDVTEAFNKAGVKTPPTGLAKEVLARVKRVRPKESVRDVVLAFRHDAIRSLSGQFGGKAKSEDALRNHLLMYLPTRGYAEAHTGKGRTDILLPPPDDVVIETKVWTTKQEYEDGLRELGGYIHTERPKAAYMVVFGDREPLPPIVQDYHQAVAEERLLEGVLATVVVVLFDVTAPSKVGRNERRQRRG